MKKFYCFLFVFLILSAFTFAVGQKPEAPQEVPDEAIQEVPAEAINEAPMLKAKVDAGEIPSLEERLPEEPLVVEPVEEIGEYGGVWRRAGLGDGGGQLYIMKETLLRYSFNFNEILPNVAENWEFGENAKSLTLFLRKGMKWNDGAPFTADDIIFYYEDVALNNEINPTVPGYFKVGGEVIKMEKLDDYTIKLSFVEPFGMALVRLCNKDWGWYAPRHYLEQFHPKYTSMDKIKEEMKKEDFNLWTDLFLAKVAQFNNPECPTIKAWSPLNTVDQPIQIFIRNPYYWKVDTAGNQLPYIDKVQETLVSDAEAILLKALAGEIDRQSRNIEGLENYTVLMQNREKGDYRLVPAIARGLNFGTIFFNFFHKDPVLRKLFLDKRFRIALSVAIDREEVNQLIFKGLGTPGQASPPQGSPWYEEKFEKSYTKYDPGYANELLDEIGLTKLDEEGYRLRPDGKELRFVISILADWAPLPSVEIAELVKGYWKKIGVEIVNKPLDTKLWCTRLRAVEHDIALYAAGAGTAGSSIVGSTMFPYLANWTWWGPEWGVWFASHGESGEEPPADVKQLMEIRGEMAKQTSAEKVNALYKQAMEIHSRNLWQIGIVRESAIGQFYVVKNNFRNVPIEPMTGESGNVNSTAYYSAQYFIKK